MILRRNNLSLLTVQQLSQVEPAFSENSLRFHVFHATPRIKKNGELVPPNGLESAITRIGRKVLIDRDRFINWVEERDNK
jgi:hypothetical protein